MTDDPESDGEKGGPLSRLASAGLPTPLRNRLSEVLGRLVEGAAWRIAPDWMAGEEQARASRESQVAFRKALETAAAQKAVHEPELVERTLRRLVNREFQKQENLEAIGRRTIELVADDISASDTSDDTAAIDDDWFATFASMAEKATTERMRERWAQLLAREIRKPGSHSLAAIQFFASADERVADVVRRGLNQVVNRELIPGHPKGALNFNSRLYLDHLGITQGTGGVLSITWTFTPGQRVAIPCGKRGLRVSFAKKKVLRVPGGLLTKLGHEIMAILEPDGDGGFLKEFGQWLLAEGAAEVLIGDNAGKQGGQTILENCAPVDSPAAE